MALAVSSRKAKVLGLFLTVAWALSACGKDEFVGPLVDAPFASVSAGVLHTCGVTTAGRAYCWGWNRDGQLGDGSNRDRAVPVLVETTLTFARASTGGGHTCGVTAESAPYCWGFNLSGQLGDGTTQNRIAPTAVSGGLVVSDLESGGAYSCGVSADSAAYCWGWGGTGQLGTDPPDVCTTPSGSDPCARSPVLVAGGLKLTRISPGTQHSCAIAADSTAYCWGANGSGQLGNGSVTDASEPVAVSGGLRFVQLTTGFDHTCGLTPMGEAYCWGANALGQLGDTAVSSSAVPRAVIGNVTFASVTAGATHTCGTALLGDGYCWGSHASGQLGSDPPETCATPGGGLVACSRQPVVVTGGHDFSVLDAGTHHTCGITTAQVAYCWGLNDRGQLGDGTRRGTAAPVRVANQQAAP